MAPEVVEVELDSEERQLLVRGLNQWGGPAYATEEIAYAMGFDSVKNLHAEASRLIPLIRRGSGLTPLDWTRSLLATEIAFSSQVLGAAGDWSIVSGMSDEYTLALLRQVQRKLARADGRPLQQAIGTRSERRPPVYGTPPPVDRATAARLARVSVEQLDEWRAAGLMRSLPHQQPDPEQWSLSNVLEAALTRQLLGLDIPLADIRLTVGLCSYSCLIAIEDGTCSRIEPGHQFLPARPTLVLDVGAVVDGLRQDWPRSR